MLLIEAFATNQTVVITKTRSLYFEVVFVCRNASLLLIVPADTLLQSNLPPRRFTLGGKLLCDTAWKATYKY